MIKSFSSIRISVTDVNQSTDWYKKLFELNPVESTDNFSSFKIGNTHFDICLADTKSPLSTGGSVGYWFVDDLDAVLLKIERLGGKIYRGPLKVPEIQRTIVQIQDPFGNVIGFEGASLQI